MPDTLLEQSQSQRRAFFDRNEALIHQLATEGQKPQVLFITCSDSRIAPEGLFGLDPGDFFVLRNVANTVPPVHQSDTGTIAALEFAVQVLEVSHIVVCGHTQCGGLLATDNTVDTAAFPALARWVDLLRDARRDVDFRADRPDADGRHRAIVEQHVRNQLANLLTYGHVRNRVDAGRLMLHGWVYYLETPAVGYLNPASDAFELVV